MQKELELDVKSSSSKGDNSPLKKGGRGDVSLEEKFQQALGKLNADQQQAVNHLEGPVLVIAGPGTGKTQVLAARIGQILKAPEAQAAPHNILCLAFSNAAAIEMRQRLQELMGPEAYHIHIYTFHAFCNKVIEENSEHFGNNPLPPFNKGEGELEVISDLEKIMLLRELIDKLPNDHIIKRPTGNIYYEVRRLRGLFSTMKKENWEPGDIEKAINKYLEDLPNQEDFQYKKANSKQGIKAGDLRKKKNEALTRGSKIISNL